MRCLPRTAEAASPDDLVRLHTEATIAHEAIGQHAQALRSQRAMTDAERERVSAATRARRMTLQFQHELDSEPESFSGVTEQRAKRRPI